MSTREDKIERLENGALYVMVCMKIKMGVSIKAYRRGF